MLENSFSGDKHRQDFLKWLSPPDPFTNYNAARDARQEDTAMWFIRGGPFKTWKESTSLFWIHGKRALSCPLYSCPY
jgi:hypothetical protein